MAIPVAPGPTPANPVALGSASPTAGAPLVSGPPTIVDPNTTLPSEGVTQVVPGPSVSVPVRSARPEPRAKEIGTMPSAAIADAVAAAKPAGHVGPSATIPEGVTPAGVTTPPLTRGHPVGQVKLGNARPQAPQVPVVHATARMDQQPVAPYRPQSAAHSTAPSAGMLASLAAGGNPRGAGAPVVPRAPSRSKKRRNPMTTLIVVGVACIALGSIGYALYAFGGGKSDAAEDADEKKKKDPKDVVSSAAAQRAPTATTPTMSEPEPAPTGAPSVTATGRGRRAQQQQAPAAAPAPTSAASTARPSASPDRSPSWLDHIPGL
jgi:hypothetical protein